MSSNYGYESDRGSVSSASTDYDHSYRINSFPQELGQMLKYLNGNAWRLKDLRRLKTKRKDVRPYSEAETTENLLTVAQALLDVQYHYVRVLKSLQDDVPSDSTIGEILQETVDLGDAFRESLSTLAGKADRQMYLVPMDLPHPGLQSRRSAAHPANRNPPLEKSAYLTNLIDPQPGTKRSAETVDHGSKRQRTSVDSVVLSESPQHAPEVVEEVLPEE